MLGLHRVWSVGGIHGSAVPHIVTGEGAFPLDCRARSSSSSYLCCYLSRLWGLTLQTRERVYHELPLLQQGQGGSKLPKSGTRQHPRRVQYVAALRSPRVHSPRHPPSFSSAGSASALALRASCRPLNPVLLAPFLYLQPAACGNRTPNTVKPKSQSVILFRVASHPPNHAFDCSAVSVSKALRLTVRPVSSGPLNN